ncbi:hypothetical protein POM88_044208 [Heracleum sosnowskyi]|uniref:C3H1-type domain-containing protein n=1 Tax=Heracleum sosnowskyi TaxID=360622 RepID=A0AAD8M4X7_9APIA|nr:hypothetical protein POM88_044208 [Heracleum sosnowskyi]
MIIDYKLIYPSGTATAHLINSFHTPQGAKLAKKQVKALGKFLSFSFLWGFFQWFYTAGSDCGFASFPSLGLKAYENRYPHDTHNQAGIAHSGGILPLLNLLDSKIGSLQHNAAFALYGLADNEDNVVDLIVVGGVQKLQGGEFLVQVIFIVPLLCCFSFWIPLVLSHLLYLMRVSERSVQRRIALALTHLCSPDDQSSIFVDSNGLDCLLELLLSSDLKLQRVASVFIAIAMILGDGLYNFAKGLAVLPQIFHQLRWYYVLVIYIFAPVLAFCNAYGCGLTDWSLASTYGKLAIFMIGAWAGKDQGGVLADALRRLRVQTHEKDDGGGDTSLYLDLPGEPNCIYFMRTGMCGYEANCRFNHPSNLGLQIGQYGAELPQRVGQPDCGYFLKTGTCKYGASCKYHHPLDRHGVGPLVLNTLGLPMRQVIIIIYLTD